MQDVVNRVYLPQIREQPPKGLVTYYGDGGGGGVTKKEGGHVKFYP